MELIKPLMLSDLPVKNAFPIFYRDLSHTIMPSAFVKMIFMAFPGGTMVRFCLSNQNGYKRPISD
jgi:hypothetical protein